MIICSISRFDNCFTQKTASEADWQPLEAVFISMNYNMMAINPPDPSLIIRPSVS